MLNKFMSLTKSGNLSKIFILKKRMQSIVQCIISIVMPPASLYSCSCTTNSAKGQQGSCVRLNKYAGESCSPLTHRTNTTKRGHIFFAI